MIFLLDRSILVAKQHIHTCHTLQHSRTRTHTHRKKKGGKHCYDLISHFLICEFYTIILIISNFCITLKRTNVINWNTFCEQWATLHVHLVNERGALRTSWKFLVAILECFINDMCVFINEFIAFVSYLCHYQILMFSIL